LMLEPVELDDHDLTIAADWRSWLRR
jgi:hypothetical protein